MCSDLDLVYIAMSTVKRHGKNLVSNTHCPQNPFKIELNKNKDEIILLNPLEIVKGLILDYDSQPRISSTTQINNNDCLQCPSTIRQCYVFSAGLVDPDRTALTHR